MSNKEQDKRELEQLRSEAAKNMPRAELQGVSTDCPTVTPEEVEAAIAAGFLGAVAFRQGQAKREPLWSDEEIDAMRNQLAKEFSAVTMTPPEWIGVGLFHAQSYIEAKITSGELMVVKEVECVLMEGVRRCGECGHIVEDHDGYPYTFCPDCGAKIVNG